MGFLSRSKPHSSSSHPTGSNASDDLHVPSKSGNDHAATLESQDGLSSPEFDDDEAAWELDDMAEEVAPTPTEEFEMEDTSAEHAKASGSPKGHKISHQEKSVLELAELAGCPPIIEERLPTPIIIPQRRPRSSGRGFVRAYAPILSASGIEEDVFLKFLKDWHKASRADPWIEAVFIASNIAGFAPDIIAMIVTTVVQTVSLAALDLQIRHRRTSFLDYANKHLFMPRGLFAMVMTFKDDLSREQQQPGPLSQLSDRLGITLFSSEKLDINQAAAKSISPDPSLSKLNKGIQSITFARGSTYGEIELPESAKLVYPDIDRAMEKLIEEEPQSKEHFRQRLKSAGKAIQRYLDYKAQKAWDSEHPSSVLSSPADPKELSPGSLVSLLKGKPLSPSTSKRLAKKEAEREEKRQRKARKKEEKEAKRIAKGEPEKKKKKGAIRRFLQSDVLYLIILPLPTPEEAQASMALLESKMATNNLSFTVDCPGNPLPERDSC
ncbi:hypothetical protein DL96DRAFT_99869 [Flagelloscypha sp. PMI_526]|nr:hypothetical protein DL96DRAFT_99869 [Flagelloscypha sp. PMI_526]